MMGNAAPATLPQLAAIEAARAAGLIGSGPVSTHLLKKAKKSLVVRIEPRGDTPFVAKRTRASATGGERRAYAELLSALPIRTLRLLGHFECDDWVWLFLEDAGDLRYSKSRPEDRWAIGEVLGRITSTTARIDLPAWLPFTDGDHYLSVLDIARRQLGERGSDLPVAADVISRLDRVERDWRRIAEIVAGSPIVLCHSDVRPENIRLLPSRTRVQPVLLDWELAAQGPSAVDLGCQAVTDENDPLIEGYRAVAGEIGGSPSVALERARAGRLLRLLNSVGWAAKDLGTASTGRGESYLATYVGHLDRVLDEMGSRS